jgi:GTP cyclohydrolase I
MCCHHLLPIIGKAHFAYIPEEHIVGLSKIPRLVDALAKRPQIQEKLTMEITRDFMEVVKPKGCGAVIRCQHGCMECRGIKAVGAYMETASLMGSFLKNEQTRSEFLMSAQTIDHGEFA